ncbi:MAG: hypothetical protein WC233_01175 [Sphaerochaeta sp.]
MKKNLIALLVVLALVTVGVFAVDNASFDVKTSVAGINEMRLTAAKFTGTTKAAFTSAAGYAGPLTITTNLENENFAYISTLSNSRVGYKVTMSATAMKSTVGSVDAFIHYTVTAAGESVDTSGADQGPGSDAKVIINTLAGMDAVASQSHAISLDVDPVTFDAAVEGEYTGTVTFTWTTS